MKNKEELKNCPVDYTLDSMPNGEFVGEVYMLTHDVINDLKLEDTNDAFCKAEETIRDYVWRSCKRAWNTRAEQTYNPETQIVLDRNDLRDMPTIISLSVALPDEDMDKIMKLMNVVKVIQAAMEDKS